NNQGSGNGGNQTRFKKDPGGKNAACVSSTANAALSPVNLGFMFDKSGGMGDLTATPPFDPNSKSIPVTTGTKSFFPHKGSAGINASLQFFPEGGDLASVCAYPYATPKVALSPLTSSTVFVDALDATKPFGGTPTLPALQGAITYAKDVGVKQPDIHTAV